MVSSPGVLPLYHVEAFVTLNLTPNLTRSSALRCVTLVHPSIDEEFGYHVVTNRIIPAPTTEEEPLIACPFGLCIIQPSARSWILSAQDPDKGDLDSETEMEPRDPGLNERQWIASYLVLHLIGKDEPGMIPSQ